MQKEEIKKQIKKGFYYGLFIITTFFLWGLLQEFDLIKINLGSTIYFFESIFNSHIIGFLFGILLIYINICLYVFVFFTVFLIINNFLNRSLKKIAPVLVSIFLLAMCLISGIKYHDFYNSYFFYWISFLLLLISFWSFQKIITTFKKRILFSIIFVALFFLIMWVSSIVFPETDYQITTHPNLIKDELDYCKKNNGDSYCLKNLPKECKFIKAKCYVDNDCLIVDCGDVVHCTYMCPK